MKTISDELALAQSPIEEEDLIVHILGQLGEDYTHIAAALKIRDTSITFPDLFNKLVDHERTLKDTQQPLVITTVNNTQTQQSRFTPRKNNDNRSFNRSNNASGNKFNRYQGSPNGNNFSP